MHCDACEGQQSGADDDGDRLTIDDATLEAVGELVQAAFEQFGGKGDAEAVIIR